MADALISIVLEQLAVYVIKEVTLVLHAREEVRTLDHNLKLVQAVLVDADQKQVKNEAVRVWLDNLKQVVYDADDVLNEWSTKDAISQIQHDSAVATGTRKKVLSYLFSPCFCYKHVISRFDIGHLIEDINMRLDRIVKQRTDFGLTVVHQNNGEPRPTTISGVDVSEVHGRDGAKEDILSMMSQGTTLRAISIVGIGGLGKTTLAKLIFNEVDTFQIKMWVCVSEPFNPVRIAKAIIIGAGGYVPADSAELEEVWKCLRVSVETKMFLLVLDDVWTEDHHHWKDLKHALNSGAPGSRIIVTTRNRTVASNVGSTDADIYELGILSDDDSWLVLRDIALVGKEQQLGKFEKLGREVATRCKGVPLAVIILAKLLFERQTTEGWKDVLASDLWEMPSIKNFLLPSLFLSYYSLPPISKQCLLYCVILPKDFQMHRDYLIRLWVSQGFFGFEERKDLEKIGKEHFINLVSKSFFQDLEIDSEGNVTSCKMHDLVHDFLMYLWKSECSILETGDMDFDGDRIRHLCASDPDNPSILEGRKLRTLVLCLKSTAPNGLFNKLACLRTLVLRSSLLEVLPNEIEKLVHLRYLDLSCSKLIELPGTVCKLYNLQTLGLNGCIELRKLPERIGNLSNLRHLEINKTYSLRQFPKAIARLSSLRTLCKFIVNDVDQGCQIGDLQHLNNLQGALVLEGLSRVTTEEDAILAEMKKKRHIRELTFCCREESVVGIGMKNIMEKLEPHEDLEMLKISDYPDLHFPSWVQSCSLITSMVKVSLYRCRQCTELPAFGKLELLKTLEIVGMGSITRIDSGFYGFGDASSSSAQVIAFPMLESLVLQDMEKLEEWELPISENRKVMPLLIAIDLWNCPMLRALPCLGKLESLEEMDTGRLSSVKYIGNEFHGFSEDSSLDVQMIAFPKLKTLTMKDFDELEEWEIPSSNDKRLMPLLTKLSMTLCNKLTAFPRVWKMRESLERLHFHYLSSVTEVGLKFLGDGNESLMQVGVEFPRLKALTIADMWKLEDWSVPFITPCLTWLNLVRTPELKPLPRFLSIKVLDFLEIREMYTWDGQEIVISGQEDNECGCRELSIGYCDKLRTAPRFMFTPLLKKLRLFGGVADLLTFYPSDDTLCSIDTLSISGAVSLPKGFNQLKALRSVVFYDSNFLDFDLEQLQVFTMLRHLEINGCGKLEQRFIGEAWKIILAHVPRITINRADIKQQERILEIGSTST